MWSYLLLVFAIKVGEKKKKIGDLERQALPAAKNPKKGLLGKTSIYLQYPVLKCYL